MTGPCGENYAKRLLEDILVWVHGAGRTGRRGRTVCKAAAAACMSVCVLACDVESRVVVVVVVGGGREQERMSRGWAMKWFRARFGLPVCTQEATATSTMLNCTRPCSASLLVFCRRTTTFQPFSGALSYVPLASVVLFTLSITAITSQDALVSRPSLATQPAKTSCAAEVSAPQKHTRHPPGHPFCPPTPRGMGFGSSPNSLPTLISQIQAHQGILSVSYLHIPVVKTHPKQTYPHDVCIPPRWSGETRLVDHNFRLSGHYRQRPQYLSLASRFR